MDNDPEKTSETISVHLFLSFLQQLATVVLQQILLTQNNLSGTVFSGRLIHIWCSNALVLFDYTGNASESVDFRFWFGFLVADKENVKYYQA